MHRLFVALRPPAEMRAQLLGLMGGVPGARWQSDDQLHLTLRFIGEVDRPQADDIAASLGTIDRPRPTIALRGAGSFGHKGRVHSVWAGVAPDEALHQLHDRVSRALVLAGVAVEQRAFKPHITLARTTSVQAAHHARADEQGMRTSRAVPRSHRGPIKLRCDDRRLHPVREPAGA